VHTSGVEGEGFEAWVRIWFSLRVGCGCRHGICVFSGALCGTMWVGGSEVLEGWVHIGGGAVSTVGGLCVVVPAVG
jgi:hypothetical protein